MKNKAQLYKDLVKLITPLGIAGDEHYWDNVGAKMNELIVHGDKLGTEIQSAWTAWANAPEEHMQQTPISKKTDNLSKSERVSLLRDKIGLNIGADLPKRLDDFCRDSVSRETMTTEVLENLAVLIKHTCMAKGVIDDKKLGSLLDKFNKPDFTTVGRYSGVNKEVETAEDYVVRSAYADPGEFKRRYESIQNVKGTKEFTAAMGAVSDKQLRDIISDKFITDDKQLSKIKIFDGNNAEVIGAKLEDLKVTDPFYPKLITHGKVLKEHFVEFEGTHNGQAVKIQISEKTFKEMFKDHKLLAFENPELNKKFGQVDHGR